MQNLGFFLVFGAFLMAAAERHLETRGRNDPDASRSRIVTVGLGGSLVLMALSYVFFAGGVRMWSVFGPILAVGTLGLLTLVANTLLGGAELVEKPQRVMMEWLEENEEMLAKWVFPFTSAVALLGVVVVAAYLFSRGG